MNCVYDAYVALLHDKGMTPTGMDRYIYAMRKKRAHDHLNVPTFGGVVPSIIKGLARLHGLSIQVQHGLLTKEHHLEDAENIDQFIITYGTDFGEYAFPITLAPAIYLLYADSHAVYSRTVPEYGVPIMAIQIGRVDYV